MAMNYFFYKVFISLLVSSSLLYLEANSQTQSNCPHLEANVTNGVTAVVITALDGELLGIRVMWRIKHVYLQCQFTTLRVELNTNYQRANFSKDISVSNTTADFVNGQFDCNALYTPRIRAVHHYSFGIITAIEDDGIPVFYRDKIGSPSQLSSLCVGPPTSPADRIQSKVNISWDPLPCHLQNGADIIYVVRYTHLLTGELANFSHSHRNVECRQEPAGPYSCLASTSSSTLFTPGVTYSIQVAAESVYGVGSFSDPVIATIGSNRTNCTNLSASIIGRFDSDAESDLSVSTILTSSNAATDKVTDDQYVYSTREDHTVLTSSSAATDKVTDDQYVYSTHKDHTGWIVMGSLVIIVAVLSGIVIAVLLFVVCVLWKRLRFNKIETEQTLKHDKSADKIDMKECSAYGQVISPQPVTEQPHIYEATT